MRNFACALVALWMYVSVFPTRELPNGQLSASERRTASQQGTKNPEAYELCLKGRAYWDKRTLSDLEIAVSYFNQAIAKDPGYALAYVGLADAYAVMPDYGGSPTGDVQKANAAAHRALDLDPTLARPHADLGYTKFVHEWDFAVRKSSSRRR